MTQEQNQYTKVNLGTSPENADWEEASVTTEESTTKGKSKTASQIFATSGEDRLKALARLIIVKLTLSMAELPQRK